MTKNLSFELSKFRNEKYIKNPIELSDIKKNYDLCFAMNYQDKISKYFHFNLIIIISHDT